MKRNVIAIGLLLVCIGLIAAISVRSELSPALTAENGMSELFKAEVTEEGAKTVASFLAGQGVNTISKQNKILVITRERTLATSLLAEKGFPPLETIKPYKTMSLLEFQTPGWAWGHNIDSSQDKLLVALENIKEALLLIDDVEEIEFFLDTSSDGFQPTDSKKVVHYRLLISSPTANLEEGIRNLILANTKADLLPSNIEVEIVKN